MTTAEHAFSPVQGTPRRRFTILDGIVLLVPLGAGFALARPFMNESLSLLRHPDVTPRWFQWSGVVIGLLSRFVAFGMLGLLLARLLPPRPPLRRLSRQPGTAACVAAAGAMAAGGLIVLTMALFREVSISSADQHYWPFIETRILTAIAAAWATQALLRRWRPEPNWIDRAGRLLGAYWFLLFAYRYVGGLLWSDFWIGAR